MIRAALPAIDTSAPPFALPPDVVLDIPVPPSVNRTRRVNHAHSGKVTAWEKAADGLLMASGQYRRARKVPGRFELKIVLCEQKCRLDADNPVKQAVDYLRRLELITNDDKRFMRKLTIEWGEAPEGCRLILREIGPARVGAYGVGR